MTRERFLSLDMFRGLTIFLMIVVNTPGPGAPSFTQLSHAPWFGFTLADLIFPTFLFAVGNAMSFAFLRPMSHRAFMARVLRRGALIFLLGVLMYWYPFVTVSPEREWSLKPFADTRLTGVLQRIALCYMLAAPIARYLPFRAILIVCAALLLGYWAVLAAFGVPGDIYAMASNVGTRIDLALIGPAHLYKKAGGFDPEGLLGTLPATVNVLAGYLVGRFLQDHGKRRATVVRLMLVGVALCVAALAWSPLFPIAKKLWTGPFVLLTVGLDMVMLAITVAMIELRGIRFGERFLGILGRNPLAIYLFSELLVVTLGLIPAPPHRDLYTWIGIELFQPIGPGAIGSLLCAVGYALLCWVFGWMLDRRGLILKV